jgi:hypothetical protein
MSERIPQALKHHLIPNAGTVVLIALLLVAFRTFAMPDSLADTAASANGINYQGYLTDGAGKAIDGNIDMTFRLYNVATGGSALWTETQTSVPIEGGLFNVMLGSSNPIPGSVWDNTAVYLGIQVGSDAEMAPREPVGRVPYALRTDYATNASQAAEAGHAASADHASSVDRAYGLSAPDGSPSDAVTVDNGGNVAHIGAMSWQASTMTYKVYYIEVGENNGSSKNLGKWDMCSILTYEVSGVDNGSDDWGKCKISFNAGSETAYGDQGPTTFTYTDQPNWFLSARANHDVNWVKCEAICVNLGH